MLALRLRKFVQQGKPTRSWTDGATSTGHHCLSKTVKGKEAVIEVKFVDCSRLIWIEAPAASDWPATQAEHGLREVFPSRFMHVKWETCEIQGMNIWIERVSLRPLS